MPKPREPKYWGWKLADLIQSARAILSVSERRMEATANNVANLTTPGFKSEKLYSDVLSELDQRASIKQQSHHVDMAQGRMSRTGNPLDLAIGGAGFFRLIGRDGQVAYSRQGQFKLDADSRLVTQQGLAVQSADGGDIVLTSSDVHILADGSVVAAGRSITKIGLFQASDTAALRPIGGSLFSIDESRVEAVRDPDLHQGMTEGSNVALADEMVAMMEAMRAAEGGAKLVQVYDDLMGKAVNSFGQGGR